MATWPEKINGGVTRAARTGPASAGRDRGRDIGAAMRSVTDASGTMLGEPVEIPGIGRVRLVHRNRGQPGQLAAALRALTTSLRDGPSNNPLTGGR